MSEVDVKKETKVKEKIEKEPVKSNNTTKEKVIYVCALRRNKDGIMTGVPLSKYINYVLFDLSDNGKAIIAGRGKTTSTVLDIVSILLKRGQVKINDFKINSTELVNNQNKTIRVTELKIELVGTK